MIALLTIGSFVNFLVLYQYENHFSEVIAAFGTLTGTMVGFYFGSKGSETKK